MENEQHSLQFDLLIDEQASTELHSAAKRAKTVALISWFFIGLCIAFFFILGTAFLTRMNTFLPKEFSGILDAGFNGSIFLIIVLVICVLVGLFVYLLYNFGNKVTNAVIQQDQEGLEAGFDSLRVYLMITGIFSVLGLIFSLTTLFK